MGIAADHAGFDLKKTLIEALRRRNYGVTHFGAAGLDPQDDYPDYVIPLAKAVASGELDRGIALCGSGVGACIAANKVPGVRAALVHDKWTARQAVQDDNANVMCLGARLLNTAAAMDLIEVFLAARFSNLPRHIRRLQKIAAFERRALPDAPL